MKQKLFKVMFLLSAIMIALCITACKADEADGDSDPTPHIHDVVIDAYVAPTCTTAGKTEGKHCSTCGEVLAEQTELPTVGHTYRQGYCSTCSLSETATASGTCGEHLTWALYAYKNDSTYALAINGWGEMDVMSATFNPSPWKLYADKISTVTLPDGLTYIGSDAFINCSALTSIEIPASVTSIGERTFSYCSSLTSVTFEKNSQLTHIGYEAFYDCIGLTSIEIPAGVTDISYRAFGGCYMLVEVWNHSELSISAGNGDNGLVGSYALVVHTSAEDTRRVNTTDEGYIFYEDGDTVYLLDYVGAETDLILPQTYNGKAYGIYQHAFNNCDRLISIEMSASVTSIGSEAFVECPNLRSVTFGANSQLTSIGDIAFAGCASLTSIELPTGVTSIGDQAFAGCGLIDIEIPSGVTSIGKHAFFGCSNLGHITVTSENTVYRSEGNCLIEKATNKLIIGCKNSIIPNSVTSIGDYAFAYSSLTSIEIPAGVTSIGEAAFSGCNSLKSIMFADTSAWYSTYSRADWNNQTDGTYIDVTDASANASYFSRVSDDFYLYKK